MAKGRASYLIAFAEQPAVAKMYRAARFLDVAMNSDDSPDPRRGGVRSTDQVANNADSPITRLWRASVRLQRLTLCVRSILASDLAVQVQVGSLHRGRLTLLVDSAGWATRLRLAAGDLQRQLSELPEFHPLHASRVRVATPQDARPLMED